MPKYKVAMKVKCTAFAMVDVDAPCLNDAMKAVEAKVVKNAELRILLQPKDGSGGQWHGTSKHKFEVSIAEDCCLQYRPEAWIEPDKEHECLTLLNRSGVDQPKD